MFNYQKYLQAMINASETTRNVRFIQACVAGEVEKVRLLLDNKYLNVDINFKDSRANDGFRCACLYKHTEIVKELLFKYDYNISKRNLNYLTKRNTIFNGELEYILQMIEAKKMNSSLNQSLNDNKIKEKKKKI